MVEVFYDTEPEAIYIYRRPDGFCRVYLRKNIHMIEEPIESEEPSEYPLISYRWAADENQMSGYNLTEAEISENFDKFWNSIEQAALSESDRLTNAEVSLSEIDNAICEMYDLIMEAGE